MARKIEILNVIPSGTDPGAFVIGVQSPDNPSGDWTPVFQGRFYRRPSDGNTLPAYTDPAPTDYELIQATQFTVIGNNSYNGRYTVYTKPNPSGLDSSFFSGSQTTVRVAEPVGPPGNPGDVSGGFITNITTFYLLTSPGAPIVVPPAVNLTNRPLELLGRNFSGWGEIFQQNILRVAQHFAAPTSPTSAFIGQTWYNTSNGEVRVWSGSDWNIINNQVFAPASSFRHTQAVPSDNWTVTHNLNVPSPFIVHHSFFVDIGGGVIKPILPQDVTYSSANQFQVTFSTPYAGYALVRA
jgi:hypothetical protein